MFYISANNLSWQILVFLLCYTLMHHENPLVQPPPCWKIWQIGPPPHWKIWSIPWGWYGYFSGTIQLYIIMQMFINQSKPLPGFRVVTSLDDIKGQLIQTLLRGENNSKYSNCLKFRQQPWCIFCDFLWDWPMRFKYVLCSSILFDIMPKAHERIKEISNFSTQKHSAITTMSGY